MAEIIVENAVKNFGTYRAIDNVSVTVADREFLVLLGPSGCGKTTLLRAIAGLGLVDSGRIMIGGKDITYASPKERNVSMVFQNYAIFPHMTVYDNIVFGLKMRKMAKDARHDRVMTAANLLHIENMLDRFPSAMSGGQRQRVAVARAIAYDADALLMDEPLSNLDALLRLEMRAELKALVNRLGLTTIYVTHDQIEALSMGDRIAVMRAGQIIQIDSPTRVYDLPAEHFVGTFIGSPPMNFLTGRVQVENGQTTVGIGDFAVQPGADMAEPLRAFEGQEVMLGVRPEAIDVLAEPAADALPVTVEVVEPLGATNLLTIHVDGTVLKVSTRPDFETRPGAPLWLRFPAHKIRWMNRDTGKAIAPSLEKVVAHDSAIS